MADIETKVRRSRRRVEKFSPLYAANRNENFGRQKGESERIDHERRCNDAEHDRRRMERTEGASNGEVFVPGYVPAPGMRLSAGPDRPMSDEEVANDQGQDDRGDSEDLSPTAQWIDFMCGPNRVRWGEITGLSPRYEAAE